MKKSILFISLVTIFISCKKDSFYTCSASYEDLNGGTLGNAFEENVPLPELHTWCENNEVVNNFQEEHKLVECSCNKQ